MRRLSISLLAALAAAGCNDVTDPDVLVQPITIESVDATVQSTPAVTATARVRGVIGDGCSKLESERQTRVGTTITIEILRSRPVDAVCTQIAILYDQTFTLQGPFPAGTYTLRVNDVTKTFTVS